MDKLTSIKIAYENGTYSDQIPISGLAQNIEWDSSHSLVDILGNVNISAGSIQYQINQLINNKMNITDLNSYIANHLNADVTNWLESNVEPVGSAVVVDNSLSIVGAAADAKAVGDALTSTSMSLSHLMDITYTKPRDLSAVTYVRGWFSGEVGENIAWNSIGTKTARTSVRIPLEKNSRISIQNSEDYVMRVFVCVRGANTILYKSSVTNRDVFVNPGINANGVTIGVNFSRKDNDALSDADLANIGELFCVFYDGSSITKSLKMPLELGTLSATSYYLYDQEGQYADFYKTMRTPHFLDVRKCRSIKLAKEFDVMTVVWYQSDYTFLSSNQIAVNTLIAVPTNAAFARFVMKNSNNASFDHYSDYAYVICEGNPKILKAIDNQSNSRNMTMCYIVDGQIGRDYSGNNSQTPQMTDTTGLLRLPPNYDNEGDPVPLIVYAHGSSDYGGKWQNAIRGQVGNDEVITYLVNEGYAVFDCFGHTEAAGVPSGKGHTYGSIDCMNCYISGIRRILDVYNIRNDGIYVTGISSGGLAALNLAFNNVIPVRACAPLAPAISIFNRFLGYNEQQRKEYAWAMGFTGDDSVLVGKNGESPTANQTQPAYTQALIDYFTDNAYKTIGYNPMWNGIVGVPLSTLLEWGLEPNDQSATRLGKGDRNAQNWANVCRICKTPIKIWVADDDHNISPEIIYNFLTTLKNGQCIGEERRVPDGEGGHYAFTSSETAHRASSKTALGIAYTDIPIYWMEMVAFFRSF